ncbi:MAG TPA: DUF488 family protein [Terriglobales bacterium]|nr:DUF488 family protein [Terriglobales bacterium]
MQVLLKRAYERPSAADGTRVLVDRLWPRGVNKQAARLDAWLKDLAPSNDLRRWFHARPSYWQRFRALYLKELAGPAAARALEELYRLAAKPRPLTLVYASRNTEYNNATVLKELLEGMRKPPSTAGPAAAARMRARAVRRR